MKAPTFTAATLDGLTSEARALVWLLIKAAGGRIDIGMHDLHDYNPATAQIAVERAFDKDCLVFVVRKRRARTPADIVYDTALDNNAPPERGEIEPL